MELWHVIRSNNHLNKQHDGKIVILKLPPGKSKTVTLDAGDAIACSCFQNEADAEKSIKTSEKGSVVRMEA